MIRLEVLGPDLRVYLVEVWRDGVWQATGAGRSPVHAAHRARAAYKARHASRFPAWAERQIATALAGGSRNGLSSSAPHIRDKAVRHLSKR